MNNIVLKVENLSKAYQIGQIGTGTLSKDIHRWWTTKVMGKEDPFLKIGEINDRTLKGESNVVWSLKDLNFEINQGDTVGIIGKNGAGKSTLLKLLSRVTAPTSGNIKLRGRVASLLEVGTGFHPELTGRENIFLNGAILGMRKKEIARKFDEIVEFSGVERYIDTPVKRYSSGMYVRLAFAVAAHLESEILIVDEVLAVGDADFQQKCLGKLGDVSKVEGRTILFVSHNMIPIKNLCKKGIFLENGSINYMGEISKTVDCYLSQNKIKSINNLNVLENGILINKIYSSDNGIEGNFNIEDDLVFTIEFELKEKYSQINVNLFFHTAEGYLIFASCSKSETLHSNKNIYKCTIPGGTLNDILYKISLMFVSDSKVISNLNDVLSIQGNEIEREGKWFGNFPGLIRPTYYNWEIN